MYSAWITAGLIAVTVPLVVAAGVHLALDDREVVLAAIHGGIGWWLAPASLVAVVAGLLEHYRTATVAMCVALLHAAWVIPGHAVTEGPPAEIRIGTANLFAVNPTPDDLLRELLAVDADVWCLQEVDADWAKRLLGPRIRARWPHRVVHPEESAFGVAVLSRRPIERFWIEELNGKPVAVVVVDGITIFDVHLDPPRTAAHTRRWYAQLESLTERLVDFPGPLVVAGDLNATRHHPSFRRLLAETNLKDSYAEVGRASAWSWPANPYWDLLPWYRIDHVLLSRDLVAVSAEEGEGHGSDHRPMVVDIARRK